MAEKKIGTVIYRKALSPILEVFRLMPEAGTPFPEYRPGQYMALSRENCRLTKKIQGDDGEIHYVYDMDDAGNQRRGSVTHSYSISSSPAETRKDGYLEFYVILEMVKTESPGRLSESLFQVDPEKDNKVTYVNKIVGDFTLEKRAAGSRNVVLVGTGTGLAPFASMIKQLHTEARNGRVSAQRFTLFHANRTRDELGYHNEMLAIEAARTLDFVYVASVSRPTGNDNGDPTLGKGRANNLLRTVFEMPTKEQQDVDEARASGDVASEIEMAFTKVVMPVLPVMHTRASLLERMDPANTVTLTCGNPRVMDDIKYISEQQGIRFEKEDW